MIVSCRGNIFESEAMALVNPVNTVGVMGAGLAAQFKARFPDNFSAYKRSCRQGDVVVGNMHVYDRGIFGAPRYIVNFPTKKHWRDPSEMSYIQDGLKDLSDVVESYRMESLAMPRIGCGLGGLSWDQVNPMIAERFAESSTVVYVYEG